MKNVTGNKLLPLGFAQQKLLQLLYFQRELDLSTWPHITPKTILPYEKRFLNEDYNFFKQLNVATVGGYLFELESFGLVERNSQFKFCLTSAGSRLAYIFIEYTKQVCLKELSGLINFKKVFKTSNHLKVLDVGCGGGSSLIAIDRYEYCGTNPVLIGLDIEIQNLIFGKKLWTYFVEKGGKAPNIKFVQADAMKFPFKSQSFDVVYSRATLQLLNRRTFLTESKRVLKPKGTLILIRPGYRYFWKKAIHSLRRGRFLTAGMAFFCILNGILLTLSGKQLRIRSGFYHADTPSFLAQALRNTGFHVLECNYHKNPFGVSTIVAIAKKIN